MHLVSDVLETVYVLVNYSHFVKRAKLLLLTYLLLTSLIVQPCTAAFAEQGATANGPAKTKSEEKTAESSAQRQITENPEVSKSQEILRKIASRRCHEIFVNLVRKLKPTNDRGMPPLTKTLIGTCPKNKDPGSSNPNTDWGEYLKTLAVQSNNGRSYKPPKPFCGLPGYSVLESSSKVNNGSYPYSIFLTEGNPYLTPQEEITDSKQMSIKQTCDYLFRPNETSDSNSKSSNDYNTSTLLDLLSNLRLPFCGYYNVLLEETSVYNREIYSKCMAPMDLLITLKDILGYSYGNREVMISENNCESVLTYLVERDYDASTSFYAHFVPSLARYDCRVLADYSVDAGCFSCAVSHSFQKLAILFRLCVPPVGYALPR
ncbi:uncharacterized protein LOC142355890 [Convolutriloba macropyga]|uniref:uncharacterized protein LOC142355890 n=1 Tax=Convolutriloba macropyga TaxID=536237 RepID=UPI003F52166D